MDIDLFFMLDMIGCCWINKFYFEIVLKSEDKCELVLKWKLLSILVFMKGGKLYLLVLSGYKVFIECILSSY